MSQSPCDGPGPEPPWNAFSQDGTPDAPPPGPELTALLGEAVANLGQLDEGQLLGAGSAARRLRAYAEYLETMTVAEFARRRQEQFESSKARGDKVRSRDGEYPAEELGFEMTATAYSAAILIDMAQNIVGRLPSTQAGMAAGVIDRDRARVISNATLHLPDELAEIADQVLAKAAPEMRLADLQQKAARLEVRLDPEGVQTRKDQAKRDRRVELRRENSGAASLAGRELDPAEALAGKASIDAEAVRLRNAGLPGTLAQIRAMILMDRIHQRNPWDRLAPLPKPQPEPGAGCDGSCGDCDGSGCDGTCGDSRDPAASPDTESDLPDDPHLDDPYYPDPHEDGQFPYDGDADEDEEEDDDEGRPAGFARRPATWVAGRPDRQQDPDARPDQHHRPRRGAARLVEHARRHRDLGPDGRRSGPRPHRGRLPPPPHPMVLHLNWARRRGHRARLRTRIPPLAPAPGQPRRPLRPPVGAARRAPD